MSQNLRLTLRTLLAYLDDTLDPAQARAIGQKVAESEPARDLIERIKLVTHRRRLTTPASSGPGIKIDPNTVAEYLDNEVTAEQAAEVEQICLASDVHLAEVAACHQVLSLILGEPLKPPPSANQRMYGLVRGPEALLHRKPPAGKPKTVAESASGKQIDETLRLGVPALGRADGWRSPLLLAGGGFIAALILVAAIFQILHLAPEKEAGVKPDAMAQTDGKKDNTKEEKPEVSKEKEDAKGQEDVKQGQTKDLDKEKKNFDRPPPESVTENLSKKDIPFAAPNMRSATIGTYLTDAKDSSILLQPGPEGKSEWKRLTAKQPDVSSARPLMSLPGSRSFVDTSRGVRLTLWGNMPEFLSFAPSSKAWLSFIPTMTSIWTCCCSAAASC